MLPRKKLLLKKELRPIPRQMMRAFLLKDQTQMVSAVLSMMLLLEKFKKREKAMMTKRNHYLQPIL